MDIAKIHAFNKDQLQHIYLVQKCAQDFAECLMNEAIYHDQSKFSPEEYEAFIDARDSLRASKDGTDEEYQKHLKGEAIQHHLLNNPHHPEFWDAQNKEMPILQAIVMYMDWKSRCLAKGGKMQDFWDYNMKKLEKQPKARAVAELMRVYYGD